MMRGKPEVMRRFAVNAGIALALGWGLILALLWLLDGQPTPVTAAPVLSEARLDANAISPPLVGGDGGGNVITVCLSGGCDYDTIQAAVDAAGDGDEIHVATGLYTDINARVGVTQVVYVSKTVTIRGGYTTTDWTTSNPISYPTTLDAQGQGRVLYITGSVSPTVEGLRITGGDAQGLGGGPSPALDAGGGVYVSGAAATIHDSRVFSNSAEYGGGVYLVSSEASLSGNSMADNQAHNLGGGLYLRYSPATLMGNTVTANSADYGGGLYLYSSGATVSGNTVATNTVSCGGGGLCLAYSDARLSGNTVGSNAAEYGGGLYLYDSKAVLSGNAITANTADCGGGLYLDGSDATLTSNIAIANAASSWGGGLYLYGSGATLTNNTVTANTADYGGGMCLYGSDATLINTVVADNQAHELGSGLYVWADAPRLLHTTLARNGSTALTTSGSTGPVLSEAEGLTAGSDGAGLYVASGNVVLTNTILVGHATGIYVAGGTTARLESTLWANDTNWDGGGTVHHNNDYTGDPAFVDPDAGDYHIEWTSAAVDRAVDAGVASDIDGDPRPAGPHSDLGADEWTTVDLSPSRKTASPAQAGAGDVLTYTIVLSNSGLIRSLNTLLCDAIPTHTTYVSDSAHATSGVLTDADGIRWTGTVTPNQAVTITFRVTVNEQVCIENTAIVTDQVGTATTLMVWVNPRRIYLPVVKEEGGK